MKLKNILFVVKDIEQSKEFYQELFGLKIIADFGTNVVLSEGLVLQEQEDWKKLIQQDVIMGGCDGELYFEEYDLSNFRDKLKSSKFSIKYVQEDMDCNSVIRLYDPDRHIIEIKQVFYN